MTLVLAFAALILLAGASFFFALAESALFSLRQWQIQQISDRSPRVGASLTTLLKSPQDLLATIVLGNTLANGAMVAVTLWLALRHDWPLLPTLGALFLFILFGTEVAPKTLAVRAPEQWAETVTRPMSILQGSAGPLRQVATALNSWIVRIFPRAAARKAKVSEEEYEELLELAHQQGALAHSEKEMIRQIISLDRRTAADVMKPRARLVCISDDAPAEEMLEAARKNDHRRLPIYDETPDTIVGILNTRQLLLDPEADLAEAVEFPSFVPETMNLLLLLKALQRQNRGIAIVMDEFGGTAGVVTIEDILEEVIGPMRTDRQDRELVMTKVGPGHWLIDGAVPIDTFRREHDFGDEPELETMGGLLVRELQVVPVRGQSILFKGMRLTAEDVDERRVRQLSVELLKKKG